eukprot:6174348-Pleurochrysis_carterae.AAC.1
MAEQTGLQQTCVNELPSCGNVCTCAHKERAQLSDINLGQRPLMVAYKKCRSDTDISAFAVQQAV